MNGTDMIEGASAMDWEGMGLRIKRAQGYRLYDERGRRYLDLYQDRGFAMWGHRPEGVLQALKSSASRGLWASYPGRWTGRPEQLLRRLFPFVKEVVFFSSLRGAMDYAAGYFGLAPRLLDTPLEMHGSAEAEGLLYWRPFALSAEQERKLAHGGYGPCFVPHIAFPGSLLPVPLCILEELPESRIPRLLTSPVLNLLTVKALAATEAALKEGAVEGWSDFDFSAALRRGPYMKFLLSPEEYRKLWQEMLEKGILLPPVSGTPAIIPRTFSFGEVAPLIAEMKGARA